MLHPWSKPVVISIAQQSASVRTSRRQLERVHYIGHPNDATELIETFEKYRLLIHKRHLQFVISNHFMRYLVLPWTPGVTARQDWLALAEQAMRTEYGATASDWILRVNLKKYGEPVIAAAMDNRLYQSILALAKHFDAKVTKIEPLLMVISQKHQSQNSFMITEPGRLLFCEVSEGKVKQFIASSPPETETLGHAKQIISRYFLLNHLQKKPVANYVSSALSLPSEGVGLNDNDHEKPVFLNKHASSHSCWLAGL